MATPKHPKPAAPALTAEECAAQRETALAGVQQELNDITDLLFADGNHAEKLIAARADIQTFINRASRELAKPGHVCSVEVSRLTMVKDGLEHSAAVETRAPLGQEGTSADCKDQNVDNAANIIQGAYSIARELLNGVRFADPPAHQNDGLNAIFKAFKGLGETDNCTMTDKFKALATALDTTYKSLNKADDNGVYPASGGAKPKLPKTL